MKRYIRLRLINIVNRVMNSLYKDETTPHMDNVQVLGLLGQLYENPTMRRYLEARESYLVRQGMDSFIEGKLTNSHGYAGQLIEIRELRNRIKAAFLTTKKLNEEKKSTTETKG